MTRSRCGSQCRRARVGARSIHGAPSSRWSRMHLRTMSEDNLPILQYDAPDNRRRLSMKSARTFFLSMLTLVVALLCAWLPFAAAQNTEPVAIDEDDLGGVVTSANGPEAGVWVIAETADLPTRYAKIVVTDDKGRYV